MDSKTILRRNYQKKFDALKKVMIEIPPQGWLKTIREFLGMTTTQLAKRIGVSQPRVFAMEKNEKNIKISTMERIADALDCDFVYYAKRNWKRLKLRKDVLIVEPFTLIMI